MKAYLRRNLGEMLLNVLWVVVTAVGLISLHYLWPYHSWSWGLLLGACVGASAMMIVAVIARSTKVDRMLYSEPDDSAETGGDSDR